MPILMSSESTNNVIKTQGSGKRSVEHGKCGVIIAFQLFSTPKCPPIGCSCNVSHGLRRITSKLLSKVEKVVGGIGWYLLLPNDKYFFHFSYRVNPDRFLCTLLQAPFIGWRPTEPRQCQVVRVLLLLLVRFLDKLPQLTKHFKHHLLWFFVLVLPWRNLAGESDELTPAP